MTQDRDRDRERGGDGGFDNVQQNYYQRGWGDHPDLHSHDGRSQASEHHGTTNCTSILCVIPCLLTRTLLHYPYTDVFEVMWSHIYFSHIRHSIVPLSLHYIISCLSFIQHSHHLCCPSCFIAIAISFLHSTAFLGHLRLYPIPCRLITSFLCMDIVEVTTNRNTSFLYSKTTAENNDSHSLFVKYAKR